MSKWEKGGRMRVVEGNTGGMGAHVARPVTVHEVAVKFSLRLCGKVES